MKRPQTASCCGDDAQFTVAQVWYQPCHCTLSQNIKDSVVVNSHGLSSVFSIWQITNGSISDCCSFTCKPPHHTSNKCNNPSRMFLGGITVFRCNAPTCTWKQGCLKSPSAEYQTKFDKNPSKRSRGSLSASWLSKHTPLWTTLICVYPQLPGRMPWDLCTRSLPSLQGNCSFHRYSSTYLSSEMLSEIH